MAVLDKGVKINILLNHALAGGTRKEALAKFSVWRMSTRTLDRLWNIAQKKLATLNAFGTEQIVESTTQAIIEQRNRNILAKGERMEYLTKVIKGEVMIEKTEVKWDPVQSKWVSIKIQCLPTHANRTSALAELNRMDGTTKMFKAIPVTPDKEPEDQPITPIDIDFDNKSDQELQDILNDKMKILNG